VTVTAGRCCQVHGSDGHTEPVSRTNSLRDGHAANCNCSAISLFSRCTVPLPTPTSAAILRMPLPPLRCLVMVFSTWATLLRATKFLPLLADALQTGEDPAADDRSFLFAKDRRHLDHGSSHGRR